MLSATFVRLAALYALASVVASYDEPFPTCNGCLPDSIRTAPGVGVEMTDTYAAVSVHHYNGSVSDLALVPASPAYTALFTRLAALQKEPSHSWLSDRLRKLNRLLGRPSTPDVATLATLLTSTHDVLVSSFTEPLPKIAISSPPLPALSWRDIHEALALAGLEHWTSLDLPYPRFIPSPGAALAARGEAICTEWRNLYACTDERLDGDLPLEMLLSVSLTNASLLTTVSRVDDAFTDTLASTAVHASAPDLGLAHLPATSATAQREAYWAGVRDHIAALHHRAGRTVTTLALQGSGGALPELRNALKDAMGIGGAAMMEQLGREGMPAPVWAAARGAALYARRRQEAPAECGEEERCFDGAANASERIVGGIEWLSQRVLGL